MYTLLTVISEEAGQSTVVRQFHDGLKLVSKPVP
jgi:hypothetical protein